MKTNGTLYSLVFALLSLVVSGSAMAQPKYDFRNATRIAGQDRKVGAQYRFPNVSTGTDALVSITAITGGVTLNTLDATTSGFMEALQPTITIPARSSGYVEFTIVFVATGTISPVVQAEVPITPIDVDGEANVVYEFDEIFQTGASYVDYNMLGNAVQLGFPVLNWVKGINIAGITYNGIDTSAKDCMFSVMNANTSTVIVRTGANNVSNQSQQRLRSIYFQKFHYPNSLLSYTPPVSVRPNTSNDEPILKVFPSTFKSAVTIKLKAGKTGAARFKLIDYSGRTLKQQYIPVRTGNNTITISDLQHISSGNYIVWINMDDQVVTRQITKQ